MQGCRLQGWLHLHQALLLTLNVKPLGLPAPGRRECTHWKGKGGVSGSDT